MTQPKDPQEFIVFKKDIGDGNGIAFKTHLATSELDVGEDTTGFCVFG